MRLRTSQSGFSLVQSILAILVVVVIGSAAWFTLVRHKTSEQQTANKPAKMIANFDECVAAGNPVMETYPETCRANDKTFTKQVSVPQDETANWLLYTPPGKEYTVRLADGWNIERYQKTSGLSAFDNNNLFLKPGTKAVVTEVSGGKDGRTGFFLNYATQNIDQIVTPGKKQGSLKTNDGLEIEKYYWVVNGYQNEGLGVSNGDSEYTYVIRKSSDRVIELSYSFQPGMVDYSSTVEKVLKTIHFN